jgi:squalene-hopene/tetraprenyl-beta-curcumene cyclase
VAESPNRRLRAMQPAAAPALPFESLAEEIGDVRAALWARQREDGHFVYELEADATIPSEYILLRHFLGETPTDIDAKIGVFLRRRQQADSGGWPLFHRGAMDISATVKAYYALKLLGDDPNAPHMARARAAVLARGGAAKANVFTRFALALYGAVPWRAVPVMPVEIMHLPRWFFFHMSKVSYWSRTVIAPLLILAALKPRAVNPRGIDIGELFTTPPEKERHFNTNPTGSFWGGVFLALDRVLQLVEPHFPKAPRARAIEKALAFIEERLNGEDGLGAIFPAMANVVMAYRALGIPETDPRYATARRAIDKLLVVKGDEAYCQPCVSPIWDTGLAAHALLECGDDADSARMAQALDWLVAKQITDVRGDWAERAPTGALPGGWAFQYGNAHYPDVDDTAVVAMALHRADAQRYAVPVKRAVDWIFAMQSANGGWGAFDVDNTHYVLNNIPFADHGALLDPPTVDVSARCLGLLAQVGYDTSHPAVARGVEYLLAEQEADGSWFGRWGANYIYGTWSALAALNAVGLTHDHPAMRRAVDYLLALQREDGGWGEDLATYEPNRRGEAKESTASQTAWACLALMAAGETHSDAVARGIAWLRRAPRSNERWEEELYTGVGFPRVFYLRYHGYAAYFPLWALARYAKLKPLNDPRVAVGL